MKIIYTIPKIMKQWLLATVLLLFFSVSVTMARQAEPGAPHPPIHLTREEYAWLAKNHTVRVRIVDWPPYMITRPVPSGVAIDYLEAIARRFNFKVEFVTTSLTWSESIEDVKSARRHFDLLLTMSRTPEREKEFALTVDYLTAPWVVYTRNDAPYIAGLESLSGKSVALEKGYVITQDPDRLSRDPYPRSGTVTAGS